MNAQRWLETTNLPRVGLLLGILCGLLLVMCSGARAQNAPAGTPTPRTPASEWLFDLALTADTLQTLDIHRHPGFTEMNTIEGRHPNQAQILGYALTMGVLHYLVTRELLKHSTSGVVSMWESGTIGLELIVVKRNASLGLRFYFP